MTSEWHKGSIDITYEGDDAPATLVIHPPTVLVRAIARRFKLSEQDADILAQQALECQAELVAKHDYIDLLNAARVVVEGANEPQAIFWLCDFIRDNFAEISAALAEVHRQTSPKGAA